MRLNSMARGVVVLDENLEFLQSILYSRYKIRAHVFRKGTSDQEIAEQMSHRILITNNSKDFLHDAVCFDFGIIATEHYPMKDESLAQVISHGIMKLSLWAKNTAFIATIAKDGSFTVRDIEG